MSLLISNSVQCSKAYNTQSKSRVNQANDVRISVNWWLWNHFCILSINRGDFKGISVRKQTQNWGTGDCILGQQKRIPLFLNICGVYHIANAPNLVEFKPEVLIMEIRLASQCRLPHVTQAGQLRPCGRFVLLFQPWICHLVLSINSAGAGICSVGSGTPAGVCECTRVSVTTTIIILSAATFL